MGCKFAAKFTGLRICANLVCEYTESCISAACAASAIFLTFVWLFSQHSFGFNRLKLGRILVHYETQLSVTLPPILVRFFKCQIDEKNVAGTETGTIQSWILSSTMIVQPPSLKEFGEICE